MLPVVRHVAIALLFSLALAACSNPLAPPPTPTDGSKTGEEAYPAPNITTTAGTTATVAPGGYPPPGTTPTTAGQAPTVTVNPYPGPATATTAPGQPTATTVVGQPGPTAVPGPLVGPEWTILYSGDLNADGRADVVAYKASSVVPANTFTQPGFTNYKGAASTIVIVQADSAGRPQVMAEFTPQTVKSTAGTLATLSPAPAAFMVSVTPGARPLISVLEINASGATYRAAIGLVWSGSSYALFSGFGK